MYFEPCFGANDVLTLSETCSLLYNCLCRQIWLQNLKKKITLFSLCLLEWSVVSSYTVLTVKHTPSFLPGFFELLLENGSLVIFLEEPLNPTTVFPYQKGFQVEFFFVS